MACGEGALPVFSVGQLVEVRIDLPLRIARAALHTAGHLIEAAGRGNPTIQTLDALAIALRIPLSDLLAFAGDTPHIYRTGPEAADVTVVIASPIIS